MYRKYKKEEFYTKLAKKEGYPARSVYKLKEIDEKFRVIRKGDRVLDLGSAPGSWLIYISQKVGERGRVVGADLEDVKINARNNIIFIKKDIFSDDFLTERALSGLFSSVISDMSPKTTGMTAADAANSLELCEASLEIACKKLKKGGNFICKIFESNEVNEFFKKVSGLFSKTRRFRPKAVWQESKEIYIIGLGFRPLA
jgi:23S rRNA (uridine2552-2'-O)-methyltransferase